MAAFRLALPVLLRRSCVPLRHLMMKPANINQPQFMNRTKKYVAFVGHRNFHKASSRQGQIIPYNLTDIGEGINEVVIKEWYVKEGDKVNQFDNICEVQSDKASVTITSRYDGYIRKIYHDVDETAKVGSPLVDIELVEDNSDSSTSEEEAAEDKSQDYSESTRIKVLATPAVRRLAKEREVDLSQVKGTGKDGRVLKDDIYTFLDESAGFDDFQVVSEKVPDVKIASAVRPPKVSDDPKVEKKKASPVAARLVEDRTVAVKGYKKSMAKLMTKSSSVPCFLYCDEVDMTNLISIRKNLKAKAAIDDIKLTYLPFFIKATSLALLDYPELNATIDEKCENITYKASHNIGVAMDSPLGLIVPNVKNVQSLSIFQIASELKRLQILMSKGKLETNDLKGGTFSLSNIGSIGGTYMSPILIVPEVAIGALGKVKELPRFDSNDQVIKMPVIHVSWSADHRVIDGATVARFSNVWKNYIENPAQMLLHMK